MVKIIIGILGLLAIVAGIGSLVDEELEVSKRSAITMILVGLLLFIITNCFTIIPTGYTGVRTTFGQIDSTSLQNGFNFKIPFIQSISKVNNKQQDISFKDKVWSVTAENTNVFMDDVVITYQINGEKSAWIYANVTNYKENLVSSTLVQSALKASSVQLTTDQIPNRSLVEPIAKEQLQAALNEKYGDDVVLITAVNIGNIDFEEGYNQALEQKQLAQKKMETAQIENKTTVEQAEAEAKAQLLKAQADADAKLVKAKAEAEANELLTSKLTNAILMDKYIEKWNGALPRVSGDNDMLLEVSSLIDEEQ